MTPLGAPERVFGYAGTQEKCPRAAETAGGMADSDGGAADMVQGTRRIHGNDKARFFQKVHQRGDCWEWTASRNRFGYGKFYVRGRIVGAHRFAYELLVGPIPQGLHLDHLCRNRWCVNPAHLEPVTQAENTRRGANAIKTHCPAGHPYDDANTRINANGSRHCRACYRERRREEYQQNPEAAAAAKRAYRKRVKEQDSIPQWKRNSGGMKL